MGDHPRQEETVRGAANGTDFSAVDYPEGGGDFSSAEVPGGTAFGGGGGADFCVTARKSSRV